MPIIDARSGPVDLSGIVKAFEMLMKPSEEEQMRQAMRATVAQNPQLLAMAARDFERDLRENPQPGLGDATQRVDVATPGSQLGVRPELLSEIQRLFPETVAERTEKETLRQGVPELQVQATKGKAQADIATSEVTRRTAQGELDAGLPEARIALERATNELQQSAIMEYSEFVKTLPQNEQQRAATAMTNPSFLNDIQHRESLSLQERLSRATQARDPIQLAVELFEIKKGFRDEFAKITDRMKSEDLKGGELTQLIHQFNNLSDDFTAIFPNDPFPVADSIEQLWGLMASDVEFRTAIPRDLAIQSAILAVHAGEASIEDVLRDPDTTVAEKEHIIREVRRLQERAQRPSWSNLLEAMGRGLNVLNPNGPNGQTPLTPGGVGVPMGGF